MAVYGRASDDEIAEGIDWYSAARTFALGLASRYDLTAEAAAGVIAAISPRLRWDLNMAYADSLVKTGNAPLLFTNKAKALAILAGEDPTTVLACPACTRGETSHECTGPKVRAFFACIIDPSSDAVCVDRHAFDVAYGRVTDEKTRKALDRKGGYDRIASAYRAAAVKLGLVPSVLQAITWVVWRNEKGIAVA